MLALLLVQRAQTLHTLRLDYLKIEETSVGIAFPDILKQTRPGTHLRPTQVRLYPKEPKLCPVNLIKTYVNKTKDIRDGNMELFLSLNKPHKPVTAKTISRWFKLCLKNAGIDTDIYQGHSLRTTGSSTAKQQGVPISVILEAGGWTGEHTFAKFYDKPVAEKGIPEALLDRHC